VIATNEFFFLAAPKCDISVKLAHRARNIFILSLYSLHIDPDVITIPTNNNVYICLFYYILCSLIYSL